MGSLLIKAGRVFDGRAERALEHAYVIIDGDAIKAVGPQTELEGSSGRFAREIDLGPEATVLPGLINMHTHMSFSGGHTIFSDHQEESYETKLIRATENLKIALSTGVTTMRDCGTLNGIAFPLRDAVERGIFQGPRIIASGQGITTTGGHLWFCGIEADSETEVRRAVRSQVKAGADFIKVFATGGNSTPGTNPLAAQYSAAEMCALTEEAQRLGKRVAAHAHGTPGVHHAIAAKVTTIEHCSFMQADGLRYEPEQARRIVSGSDAGVTLNTFADYPGDLVYTAEGTDLSPVYVLKSATSVAAEALGRDDLGLLVPGKASDLLAVRGNPLQDIRALLSPQLVVARGRVVYE